MAMQIAHEGGKTVTVDGTKYVVLWNGNLALVMDQNQVIKANGVIDQNIKVIDDVAAGNDCIWFFGKVDLNAVSYGVAKLSTVTWQVVGSLTAR